MNVSSASTISDMSYQSYQGNTADKLAEIALVSSVIASAEKEDSSISEVLNQLLVDLLFGTNNVSPISPSEQAEMINELISSGQPGSISKAMADNVAGTEYSQTGMAVAAMPVGAGLSVTA